MADLRSLCANPQGGRHLSACRKARKWLSGAPAGAAAALVLACALSAAGVAQEAARPRVPVASSPPSGATVVLDEVRAIDVTSRRIDTFERNGSTARRFGRLEFRGGLVLSSAAKAFGGFSGIAMDPDGRHFVAVTDAAGWLSAEIDYDGSAPAGLKHVRMGPFRGIGGRSLDRKRDLDAEAVTLLDGTLAKGMLLVGFERNHRIGRFPVVDGIIQNPVGYLKLPPEAKRMRTNKGFEAVAVLHGGAYKGSVIAFSERFPDNVNQHAGWLWIKGEPQRIGFDDIGEFEVTDATSLPDGTLLVLERRFRWTEGVKMRIRRFPAREVKPGAVMQGETLIEASLAQEIDNMEGLAVHRSARGETVLTLISDDNYNHFLQRTLLLQFTLLDETEKAERP